MDRLLIPAGVRPHPQSKIFLIFGASDLISRICVFTSRGIDILADPQGTVIKASASCDP